MSMGSRKSRRASACTGGVMREGSTAISRRIRGCHAVVACPADMPADAACSTATRRIAGLIHASPSSRPQLAPCSGTSAPPRKVAGGAGAAPSPAAWAAASALCCGWDGVRRPISEAAARQHEEPCTIDHGWAAGRLQTALAALCTQCFSVARRLPRQSGRGRQHAFCTLRRCTAPAPLRPCPPQ